VTTAYDIFHSPIGRVFFQPGVLTTEEASALSEDEDEDDDRRVLHRQALSGGVAVFVVHQTIEYDVVQAFLLVDGVKIFACAVISIRQLQLELETVPFVVEGLSVRVANTMDMTTEGLTVALRAWCEMISPHRSTRVIIGSAS
jgi:hypothetical protein